MFLLDDVLLAPGRALWWVVEQIAERAEAELYDEEPVLKELSSLYASFEAEQISLEQFEAKEQTLLDRLEQIKRHREGL
ncbi:MAG: gas vesicle protein GvpG [Candidatus Binatota bacterium]